MNQALVVEDPEKRDIDPATDKVWRVDVWYSVDFTMYVVADSKDEAEECAEAHWKEEERENCLDHDASLSAKVVDGPIKDPDWMNSNPWGRCTFRGKELRVNQIIELIANPPPPPGPKVIYDDQTLLMPFVDSPPPIYVEEEE